MSRRTEQVSELIREELSVLLAREVRDPRVAGIVSVTHVDVSPDLRRATRSASRR
jgi:ribosome-binding factor A